MYKKLFKAITCLIKGHVGVGVKCPCAGREVFTCKRCGKFLSSRRINRK
jgi:hypothetical protein